MFMSNDGLNYLESGIAAVSLPAIGEQVRVFVRANSLQPGDLRFENILECNIFWGFKIEPFHQLAPCLTYHSLICFL